MIQMLHQKRISYETAEKINRTETPEDPRPCSCGLPVKALFIAGCTKEIAKAIRHPYGGRPGYYIKCACGRGLFEPISAETRGAMKKARAKLVKAWNKGFFDGGAT